MHKTSMIILDTSERACLKSIAQGQPDPDTPCSTHTLQLLESLELIERVPRIRLPWLPSHDAYRLTARGWSVLERP